MILHIAREKEWLETAPRGDYRADSLAAEGFIHCSTPQQVLEPANEIFRGQIGLVLLCIDPDNVSAPLIYEDCYESGHEFPHIYGPLDIGAVTAVIRFHPLADGSFALPSLLEQYR